MTTVAVDLVVEERGGSFRVVAQPKLDPDRCISAGGVNVRFYCVFALGCVVFEKRYLVHVWRCVVESSEQSPSLRRNGAMNLNKKNCELRAARSALAEATRSQRFVMSVVRESAQVQVDLPEFAKWTRIACARSDAVHTPVEPLSDGVDSAGERNARTSAPRLLRRDSDRWRSFAAKRLVQ